MILYGAIIVTQQFYPSPLSQVQILLMEIVLETFIVYEDLTCLPVQVMPPNLKGKHNYNHLQIVSKVIMFMLL
jgi:hypothetical protein